MKNILRHFVFAALLSGAAQTASYAAESCTPEALAEKYPSLTNRSVKVGMDPQTAPFAMRDLKDFDKIIGLDAELSDAVFECMGIKHEKFLGQWAGLLPAVTSGQIDVFWDNLYYKPERAKQLDFVLYMQAGTGALHLVKNKIEAKDLPTSCGLTYAAGLGTVQAADITKAGEDCEAAGKPAITLMTYPEQAAGLRLVESGRADVMLSDLAMTDVIVAEKPDTYARKYIMLTGITIGVGVKNDDTELMNAIRDGLSIMHANGKLGELMIKYGVDPSLQVPIEIKTE